MKHIISGFVAGISMPARAKSHLLLNCTHLTIGVAMWLAPLPAYAYIDPNTGGFLFQLLAPLFALAISAWLFFADKLKSLWTHVKKLLDVGTQDEK